LPAVNHRQNGGHQNPLERRTHRKGLVRAIRERLAAARVEGEHADTTADGRLDLRERTFKQLSRSRDARTARARRYKGRSDREQQRSSSELLFHGLGSTLRRAKRFPLFLPSRYSPGTLAATAST